MTEHVRVRIALSDLRLEEILGFEHETAVVEGTRKLGLDVGFGEDERLRQVLHDEAQAGEPGSRGSAMSRGLLECQRGTKLTLWQAVWRAYPCRRQYR